MKVLRIYELECIDYEGCTEETLAMYLVPDDADFKALVQEWKDADETHERTETRWANGHGSGVTVRNTVKIPFHEWIASRFERVPFVEIERHYREVEVRNDVFEFTKGTTLF